LITAAIVAVGVLGSGDGDDFLHEGEEGVAISN
jgi:hypothetical protein